MNPPYSQGTKADPDQYELSFIEHLLDSLTVGARAAVIVPQSSMTGKSKAEQVFKASIMKHHTLEGVITCNTDTFYGVGTNPVIAVFTAHEPHDPAHVAKFIDFRDDGYEVRAHVGLVEGDSAKDKKQHLLDVWFGRTEAASKFCVESTVKPEDEWLHSFYYFNDEIPTDADFEKAIGDYLTFEFSMVMQNREYLFKGDDEDAESK
ncbi:N-6 DNA methylase [Bifidobacterium cuniculi]|uniref:site-specific DNA-methyltransferase (adenine-specific) n=1 Tax=Bifidobacterium cuniculi TaxID=1688 RepID=A0A087AWA3_9BIFI|nr:N-6 DNA methylase [Bifidobacterium cuniculi]KFI63053.1 restriction enzyme BgcI subunit alpha [Bifidobacterium cuniculi]